MSYRDLEDDDPAQVEHLAEVVDAPDPTQADEDPAGVAPTVLDPQPGRETMPRWVQLAILAGCATAVAAFIWFVIIDRSPAAEPGAAPVVTVSTSPAAPTPPAAGPSTDDTTAPELPAAPPPEAPPEATAAPEGAAATRALTSVRLFVPAWTMKGTPAQRRDALTPVTTARLVEALADVAPEALPSITGDPRINTVTGTTAVVEVPTSAGIAQLTVEPVDGRWLVNAVSLAPPPVPTPPAPA